MAKKQLSDESISAKSLVKTNGRVRRVKAGDISPTLQPAGIERHVVAETIEAARDSKLEAVESIVASQPPHDVASLAKSLARSWLVRLPTMPRCFVNLCYRVRATRCRSQPRC